MPDPASYFSGNRYQPSSERQPPAKIDHLDDLDDPLDDFEENEELLRTRLSKPHIESCTYTPSKQIAPPKQVQLPEKSTYSKQAPIEVEHSRNATPERTIRHQSMTVPKNEPKKEASPPSRLTKPIVSSGFSMEDEPGNKGPPRITTRKMAPHTENKDISGSPVVENRSSSSYGNTDYTEVIVQI